jgi:hypothetical protein
MYTETRPELQGYMIEVAFDSSAQVVAPSAQELSAADEAEQAVLAYTHGNLSDGRPYYAYVAVKPSKYAAFYAATAERRRMRIGDYGTVIKGGLEITPPPEVIKEMRVRYGFDDQYEEKLKEQALKQQKDFVVRREELRIENAVAMLKRDQGTA